MISQAIFNEYVRKEAYMSQMLNLFSECSEFFSFQSVATERKYSLLYDEEIKAEVGDHHTRNKPKVSYSKLNG